MFTGIIRQVGTVRNVQSHGGGVRLVIDLGPLADELADGDSVAVAGVCLTVAGRSGRDVAFDVVAETLARSTLNRLRAGAKVNLERALALGDRLDGHLVQGHVDGVAEVRSVDTAGGQWQVEFSADRNLTDAMVPKGSVAIDGVSLTLVSVADGRFSVALIPTTLAETTLRSLVAGDRVNVEIDVIGKYVRRYLAQIAGSPSGGLTLEKLREAGFA